MITLEDIRTEAKKYPNVLESTHFKLPAFKVEDKTFIVIQSPEAAIFSVSKADCEEFCAANSSDFAAVWRSETIFVGIRVNLLTTSRQSLSDLVTKSWSHKAPKALVTPELRQR